MAKPNYQFEKRQRDLAKKRKKEEKLRVKQANKASGPDDGSVQATDEDPSADPASPQEPGQPPASGEAPAAS